MIPFPPFEPDKSPFAFQSGDNLLNCLPSADGWKSMPGLVEVSEALAAECRGAVYYKDTVGTITIIAGTASDLYKLDTSVTPYAWTNVSKSSGAYNVPVGDRWSFTIFGDYLIAHSLGDVPQYISLSSGTAFADLAGSPPVAKYSWVAGDFLVFGHLENETNAIQWSGLNNAEFWTLGERGADKQLLPDGGEVQAGIGDSAGAIIVQRDKMRLMQFAPSSGYTFTFSEANTRRGTISAKSVVVIGPGQFAYLCEDGFFAGVEGRPIGAERVDSWFLDQIDLDYLQDVKGVADPFEKIAWWRFQTTTGASSLIGYDWQLDRWCYSDIDMTEAAAMASPAITWDGLGDLYATIDDIDVPFDSRLFFGGRPVFACFTSENKLAFLSGQALAATMETASIELTQGARTFVNGARVITDATGFTVTTSGADYHGGTFSSKSAASPSARSGHVSLRHSARLHRFKVEIPSGSVWSIATGLDVMALPEGMQ